MESVVAIVFSVYYLCTLFEISNHVITQAAVTKEFGMCISQVPRLVKAKEDILKQLETAVWPSLSSFRGKSTSSYEAIDNKTICMYACACSCDACRAGMF